MHEYSIVRSLIERVEAEAQSRGATSVHRIRIRIGKLAGVEPTLLATAYEVFRDHTICRAAQLEVQSEEAEWALQTGQRRHGWPTRRENVSSLIRGSRDRSSRMTASVRSGEGSSAKMISKSSCVRSRMGWMARRNSGTFSSSLNTGTMTERSWFCAGPMRSTPRQSAFRPPA
jgi:hydrogenase nickel insertion protein HypA